MRQVSSKKLPKFFVSEEWFLWRSKRTRPWILQLNSATRAAAATWPRPTSAFRTPCSLPWHCCVFQDSVSGTHLPAAWLKINQPFYRPLCGGRSRSHFVCHSVSDQNPNEPFRDFSSDSAQSKDVWNENLEFLRSSADCLLSADCLQNSNEPK